MAELTLARPAANLYVHVPFCARKCEYCAFYSTAADADLVDRYVAALIHELEIRRDELAPRPATMFFGGGTPSLLTLKQWERILRCLDRLRLLGAEEWTVESNPATVSADKARLLRDAGVNRMSMGVQSLDEELLDRLGRVHSRDMVFRSYDTLRAAGFSNLNLDLMFAIPGQSIETWHATLREALAMGSEHLSSYEVIYEEDTPLFEQLKAGEFDVDESLASQMFEDLVAISAEARFRQYEIANFARDQKRCQHNLNYWRGGSYAAFGPSASGFEGGTRYRNVANTRRYCELLERGELPRDWSETLEPIGRAGEIAAFGLRRNEGWVWDEFHAATGFDLREHWDAEMTSLVRRGWGVRGERGFRLTPQGLRFADAAGSEFLRSGADFNGPGTLQGALKPGGASTLGAM